MTKRAIPDGREAMLSLMGQRAPPGHDQNRSDQHERDCESDPNPAYTPSVVEAKGVSDRHAENPITGEMHDGRRTRISQAAQRAGGDDLTAVEQLEERRNPQ